MAIPAKAPVDKTARNGEWSFLKGIAFRNRDLVNRSYSSVEKAAMGELSGLTGGYITPVEYSTLLLNTIEENSLIRPRALVVPMTSGETVCPKVNVETAQAAGTSPFFGGVLFGWGQGPAGTTVSESEPTFNQLSLKPCDLIGQLVVSNQFLMDIGTEGERHLVKLFGRAAAWYEDYAYLRGSGTALLQPLGMLNSPSLLTATRSSANHILQGDINAMSGKMLPISWNNAIWICSPTAFAEIAQTDGFVSNMSLKDSKNGFAGFLLSRPLYVSEKLPALGTSGDVMFVDPSLYVIGDRQQVVIDSSPHPLFTTNQTVFRVWLRVDGKPLLDESVTLADATSPASTCIALTT